MLRWLSGVPSGTAAEANALYNARESLRALFLTFNLSADLRKVIVSLQEGYPQLRLTVSLLALVSRVSDGRAVMSNTL